MFLDSSSGSKINNIPNVVYSPSGDVLTTENYTSITTGGDDLVTGDSNVIFIDMDANQQVPVNILRNYLRNRKKFFSALQSFYLFLLIQKFNNLVILFC